MSKINGDKARQNVRDRKNVKKREKIKALLAAAKAMESKPKAAAGKTTAPKAAAPKA